MRFIIEGSYRGAKGPYSVEAEDATAARRGAEEAGILVDAVTPEAEWKARQPPPEVKASGSSVEGFFLAAGQVLCVLACIFVVLRMAYGLITLQQVASVLTVSPGRSVLLVVLIVLEGIVSFLFSAALLVVFVRVSRLH
jgi:hypothetical protein